MLAEDRTTPSESPWPKQDHRTSRGRRRLAGKLDAPWPIPRHAWQTIFDGSSAPFALPGRSEQTDRPAWANLEVVSAAHGVAFAFLFFAVLSASPTAGAPGSSCAGDCDADRRVTISELVRLVNAALSSAPSPCSDGNTSVGVSDVVSAVGFALDGCPMEPDASPTMGATPAGTVDPQATGACYLSSACDPRDVSPHQPFSTSRRYCCEQARLGAMTNTWCPLDQYDVRRFTCAAGCADACEGFPTVTVGPSPTASPRPTATSCRAAVIPVVAPVTSPTDQLEQTIYLCGAAGPVVVHGAAGSIEYDDPPVAKCPLQCPDPRQTCVSGRIPLHPNQLNVLQVCQNPGTHCGPLPDLCAEEDVNGAPLVIEQRSSE